jgi:8-oxo-dGTP pyrophosphatase MutT (NUDIX family)
MDDRLIQKLETGLKQPLPGEEVQYQMAHVVRQRVSAPPKHARQAAVLALFYPLKERWHLVFIERQSLHPEDRHAGQISFPGGRYEEGDNSLQETALREAKEEIGVDIDKIKVLGRLTHLYIPVSNYLVNPFVGVTQHTPEFTPEEREVRSILQVPLDHLNKPETRQKTDMKLSQNITLRNVPYFNVEGKVLWGATAMIVNELLTILND